MFEKLTLRNCQKHKVREFDLANPITILGGKSGSGKTAAIRALAWLAFNKLDWRELLRHGRDEIEVELIVDGKKVTRTRSKSKNIYAIDGSEYPVPGTSVPDEVAKLLNVDETNFSFQLDAPFWFLETPGQVSRELNRVVALDEIDTTLANLDSAKKKAKAAVEVTQDRLTAARQERKSLLWAAEADEKLKAVEADAAKVEVLERDLDALESLLAERERLLVARERAEKLLPLAEKVLESSEKVLEAETGVKSLSNILEQLEGLQGRKERVSRELKAAETRLAAVERCPLCDEPLKKR